MLGFPGGLIAAYGLRRHAQQRIAPLGLPRIYGTLRLAGLALGAYAFLGGPIAAPAPFFPANVLNTEWVVEAIVIPPQAFRSLAGLIMAVAIIRALEVFEVETDRLIERMEATEVIAVERERIGRDLHDGAIQRLYAAGLLAESLRNRADGALADGLERLMATLNETITDLRRYLSDLRPGLSPAADAAPTADLGAALASAVEQARRASGAHLTVRDDGRGLPPNVNAGYGLRNMRDRARLLGGRVDFEAAPGRGTVVTLTVPLEREV